LFALDIITKIISIINKQYAVEYKWIILSEAKRRDSYAAKETAWRSDTYVGRRRYVDGAAFTGLGVYSGRGDGGIGVLYIIFLKQQKPPRFIYFLRGGFC